jgi:L-lactate dehydrogenase (cytochrome)
MKAAAITDYRAVAQVRVPRFLFDYLDGGSYSETTLRRNVSELQALEIRQRVLRDVSSIDLQTTLFGQSLAMPVALAPVGLAGMYARRGETQAARAAEAAGIPFTLSTVGVCPIAEVAAATTQPFWFQLYVLRDRGFMRDLLARARDARCSALVFTVDLPVPGTRYRDLRSGLAGASGLVGSAQRMWQVLQHPRWAVDVGLMGGPLVLGNVAPMLKGKTGLLDFFGWVAANFDPSVTWADLDWIRAEWDGPLIIKGVLDPEDACEAVRLGADGIVVSNHGGRQLDGAPSTIRALPRVRDAVGDALTVLADGGVRSGLDVVRMLASGADGVLIGRAWVNALAVDGEGGVARVLALMAAEMRVTMALAGVTRIDQITPAILA